MIAVAETEPIQSQQPGAASHVSHVDAETQGREPYSTAFLERGS